MTDLPSHSGLSKRHMLLQTKDMFSRWVKVVCFLRIIGGTEQQHHAFMTTHMWVCFMCPKMLNYYLVSIFLASQIHLYQRTPFCAPYMMEFIAL